MNTGCTRFPADTHSNFRARGGAVPLSQRRGPMHSPASLTIGLYEKALPADLTWPQRLAATAKAGFDFIEISIDESDERLARLDWGPTQRAALRRAAADSGVRLTGMCLSAHRRFPLGSAQPDVRKRGLDILQRAVDLALDIGVRIVLVPGYDVFYEPGDSGTRERFLEGLRRGLDWAAPAGLMLALENTEHFLTSVTQAMDYVSALNSPWFQLYGDVGNLLAMGHDVLAELQAGAGHFAGIHVKDTLPGVVRNVPFGEGQVPFADVFAKLWEIGFNGPIMIEMWAGDDALRAAEQAQRWVRAQIEASLPAPGG